jgi:hypothetical protein
MFDDDPLEQRGGDTVVPDTVGVHDHDRSVAADTQARRLSAFHSVRPKEKIFTLKKLREQGIKLAAARIRRTKTARAHENVSGVRLHLRLRAIGHLHKISAAPELPLVSGHRWVNYP